MARMRSSTPGDMQPVFGRVTSAMITPFTKDLRLDLDKAAALARHLVDDLGHDGLIINGTTGESPTTSDEEKNDLLRVVVQEVGDRARVVAGVGTFSTEHSCKLARDAAEAGAHGVLVVTPYYSRPPADALEAHFRTVADETELLTMLYDIPHRSGLPIPEDMLIRLAEHPRIVAVKDAKGNVSSSSVVIANTDLHYYAGDDAFTLPLLAVGGVGVVGTSTHFTARPMRRIIESFLAGDVAEACRLNQRLLPALTGVFATQGCMMVKATLGARGFDVGECRAPMGKTPAEFVSRYATTLEQYADL